ncbi:TPA: hypothetical protein DIV49_03825 [Candidatus Saccharibacteria bacterium]|nr:hypothetical protein [Candidatus Saccharibacteria bacterium]HRJ90891.1 hypothetical protein [Candidatus Saccharibacteria bacterium]
MSEFPLESHEHTEQPEGVPAILTHDGADVAGYVIDVMRDAEGNAVRYRFVSEDGVLGTVVAVGDPALTLMGEPEFDDKTGRASLEDRLDADTAEE